MEEALLLQIEHTPDKASLGIEYEGVQGALGTGACDSRVFRERELEKGVQLYALAAEAWHSRESTGRC